MDPGRNLLCSLISQRNPGSERSSALPEVIAVDGGRRGGEGGRGAQGPVLCPGATGPGWGSRRLFWAITRMQEEKASFLLKEASAKEEKERKILSFKQGRGRREEMRVLNVNSIYAH